MKSMKRLLMGCGAAAWLAWGVSGAAITAQPGADGTISIPVAEPGIYKLELKARAGGGGPRGATSSCAAPSGTGY